MSVRIRRQQALQSSPQAPELDFSGVVTAAVARLEQQARESVRCMVQSLFQEEVEALAGQANRRGRSAESGIFRSGSDPGSVKFAGQRLRVTKPRLKRAGKEVPLQSYRKLRDWDALTPRILEHMVRGVSTRDYDALLEEISGGLGLSKSSVSRAFIQGSKQALEKLRTRDLKGHCWVAVHIDGIHFASRNVTVALGIDGSGMKVVLGMKEGNTESATVCTDLLQDLIDRGLDPHQRFLFVIDGGKGIRRAIRNVFGEDWPVQRCRIHKARNIEEYLPERAHPEFRRRWNRIRAMERYSDAQHELAQLRQWLHRASPSAADSLDEAGEELLTALRLGAKQIIRRALTSTNIIESVFSQIRHRSFRVKNWRVSGDQIQRWMAVLLLDAEKRCNRIHGYFDCPAFADRLQTLALQASPKAA
jgi:putative transposase